MGLGQWFNSSALQAVARIRDARLLVPHISVPHVGFLDFRELRALGIRGVILDKDNTLTAPYADDAFPGGVAGGLDECRAVYGTDAVILSNSAGTGDDPGHAQALAIEASLGLPVLRHALKKPACMDAVREHFGEDVRAHELCAIGDRLLTDVLFGHMHGMLTVHTEVLTTDGDNPAAAVVRSAENALVLPALRGLLRVAARPHPLFPDAEALQRVVRDPTTIT